MLYKRFILLALTALADVIRFAQFSLLIFVAKNTKIKLIIYQLHAKNAIGELKHVMQGCLLIYLFFWSTFICVL